MAISVADQGEGHVAEVHGAGAGVLEVDNALLLRLFRTRGAVWLRGFTTGPHDFLALVRRFSSRQVVLNAEERRRHLVVPQLQGVTPGAAPLNFHVEMGHVPHRPHFLALWCERAATHGGQTLLVDGVAAWSALSPSTRALLSRHGVLYEMHAPHAWWTDRVGGRTAAAVRRFTRGVPGFTFHLERDGSLTTRWCTRAAFIPMFGRRMALASNVFPYAVPGLRTILGNGNEIPPVVTAELQHVAAALCRPVQWKDDEVVVFDNTRWLHGRAPTRTVVRRVQMLMGYLDGAPRRASASVPSMSS